MHKPTPLRLIAILHVLVILSLLSPFLRPSIVDKSGSGTFLRSDLYQHHDARPFGVTSPFSSFLFASAASSKGIYVNVEASWTETPLLQEGLEWAARGGALGVDGAFSGDSFDLLEHLWKIASAKWSTPPPIVEMSQAKQYELLKMAALLDGENGVGSGENRQKLKNSEILGRFEMEMGARMYSPAVESHYALAAAAMTAWRAAVKQGSGNNISMRNAAASLCASGRPLFLLYAPGASVPQRVESIAQVHETTAEFQRMSEGEGGLLGKEAWRRELWLGEDAAGFSFLHLFPSSPLFSDASMVLVLFGLPLDKETIRWISEVKEWLGQLELRRASGERVPTIRFLFGHLPLSMDRLCETGRYRRKDKLEMADAHDSSSEEGSGTTAASTAPSYLWDTPLFVQGYGVTVDLRDMEYKVVDKDMDVLSTPSSDNARTPYPDGALVEEDETPIETEEQRRRRRELRDVEGFFFSTLTTRYPNLAVQLETFASELEDEEAEGNQEYRVNYNIKEMERMGYGALHYLHTVSSRRSTPNSTDQFETLLDVVFNFPLYAAKFSRLVAGNRVDMMGLHRELDAFKNLMRPGQTMAFFDGFPLTKQEMSIHAILHLVNEVDLQRYRIEQLFKTRMMSESEQLKLAGVGENSIPSLNQLMYSVETDSTQLHRIVAQVRHEVRKAVKQQTAGGGVAYGISSTSNNFGFLPSRIRLDPSVIIWLNDVERDPQYASLNPSLRGLRQLAHGSTDPNHIPRRNIFNVVSVMDPTTPSGLAGLTQVLNLVRQAPPIRIGIVLVQETWETDELRSTDSNLTIHEERAADLLKSLHDIHTMDIKPEDLTDESDSGGLNATTRDGAYALILETITYLYQNNRRDDIIEFLERLYTLLDQTENQRKADEKRPEPKPLLLHRRQKRMIINLKATTSRFIAYRTKLEDDTGKTVMVNFYNHIRDVMGEFLFPSYPTVLLNGVKLNPETSFVLSLQAEARALYPLVESRVLLESMSSKEISEAIMKRFHATNRNQRALEESLTMPYWRGGTRTFSWVPSLLSFYEHRLFLTGGMHSVGSVFPTSVASGVVLFPREPTLRSLELFGKILDAADELSTVFRVTFLTFTQYTRAEETVIEGTLESLLQYTYGEDWEMDDVREADDLSKVDARKLKKKQSEGAIRREKCRFSAVQRFVQLVLSLASKMALNFDKTFLRDEKLISAVAKQLSSVALEQADPILFEYWTGMRAEIESSPPLLKIRRERQKQLRDEFKQYIRYQAVPQGVLGRALGFEPPLKQVSTDDNLLMFSPLVLLLHGRAIRLDSTFTRDDVEEAVHRVLPLSSILHNVLQQVSFDHFKYTREGKTIKYHGATEKPMFLSARIALFAALLTQTEYRIPPLISEADLFPAIQSNSRTMFRVVSPTPSTTRHHLVLVLDPTKREAQTFLGLAKYLLRSSIAVDISVYLNPGLNPQPIRSFYKFVAQPQLVFHEKTGQIVPPAAVFRRLPTRHLLTLAVEEPESWNVFSYRAEYDLDNIYLSSLPAGTSLMAVSYRLQSLVLSGLIFKPAREDEPRGKKNSRPVTSARGLPLSIVPYESEIVPPTSYGARDTLVMSSSGYFQLPTRPGLWKLSIPPGKLAKNFYLSEVEGRSTAKEEAWWPHSGTPFVRHGGKEGQRIPIMIDAFYLNTALFTYDRVWPHHGILADMNRRESCEEPNWKPLKTMQEERKPSLHIFSVASGHLYERFLRMMMHSVFRSSALSEEADVDKVHRYIKFWVIENFLSPQFKAMIPKMAAYYGFEVGFVSYHWPSWLPQQTEKQRKIWAYKILFLDVLFPLEVDRIIFVDADQTVLTDLHELYRLDFTEARRRRQEDWEFQEPDEEKDVEVLSEPLSLESAPTIAMTPFCSGKNKNRATGMYRFWEEHNSFWRNHLMGLPYHISAIFLVDVKRFRALGGGDMYRAAYSHLSQDPHSLSNLDQDLPNFLQHQVPIYSLPESWLWCETWCNSDSRFYAKTIDLCNNPLTKTPKLINAKTIIKHWESLDQELDELFVKLSNASFVQMHKIETRLPEDLHESYSIPQGPSNWKSEPLDQHEKFRGIHDDL